MKTTAAILLSLATSGCAASLVHTVPMTAKRLAWPVICSGYVFTDTEMTAAEAAAMLGTGAHIEFRYYCYVSSEAP